MSTHQVINIYSEIHDSIPVMNKLFDIYDYCKKLYTDIICALQMQNVQNGFQLDYDDYEEEYGFHYF